MTTAIPAPQAEELSRYLDGPYGEVRDVVREYLAGPEFERPIAPPPTDEYRALVMDWAKRLAANGRAGLGFPEEFGGMDDVAGSIAAFETLALGELSLLVNAESSSAYSAGRSCTSARASTMSGTCTASRASSSWAASR